MRPLDLEALELQLRQAIDRGVTGEITRLADEFDRRERPRRFTLINSALYYASQGLRLFPLQPGTKKPLPHSHGVNDATTDISQIRAWWQQIPDANIGIATGHQVDVIDIDGPHGVRSWAQLADLPPVLGTVNTPRPGGTHLYVAATGDRNAAGLFPGIDYRGLGGYVVAPPSTTTAAPDVKYPGVYTWRRPLIGNQARQAAA